MDSRIVFRKLNDSFYGGFIRERRICIARYSPRLNCLVGLQVNLEFQRTGVATAMVEFIAADLGKKLNRCPNRLKNDSIRALSAKMGDKLLPELDLKNPS